MLRHLIIDFHGEASSTSTKPIQKQSFSSGSVIPTGSWRESYFTTGKPNSLVIPQQTGSNPLVILRCCSVGYSTMHSISKLHRGWEWKSSLTHYPTTTTNKYPLVRFRCINVKMTREFGWDGITRWQESYSTSPIPPSYLVVWLVLFVSPMPPSYLVAWFILFVINQVHRHIWLFGLSCLLSTNFTIIFGCSQYFQQGWTHQCRYIWNNVGLLCCPVLLEVVVASDSGKYQHQRLLIPSLLF